MYFTLLDVSPETFSVTVEDFNDSIKSSLRPRNTNGGGVEG